MKKYFTLLFIVALTNFATAQTQNIENFLTDAAWYTDRFISPSTDAAVYICSANWMTTAKKRKLFDVNFTANGNLFFIPKSDRDFIIHQSDFKFFTSISDRAGNVYSEVTVPTIYGNDTQYKLTGSLSGQPLVLTTPEGVNKEVVPYPYLQASVGLWKGFELALKYSPELSYKDIHYQVYGAGVKHNFSQYFKKMETKNIYFSGLVGYSKEIVTSHFIEASTQFGTLGLNQITGNVRTWQFQLSASKEWKRFELIGSVINNYSSYEYFLSGDRGTIEDNLPGINVQGRLNSKLETISANKWNNMFELSGRYQINNIYLQASATFGKFLSAGLSAQYEFHFGKKAKVK